MRNVSAIAVAAIFGLGAWQAASAADLPRRAPPAAAVYAPVSSWTGCYIGGNAGAGWGSGEISSSAGTISGSTDSARFVGGGQIGCDWQTGAWVFGIRNMLDWADAERSGTIGAARLTATLPDLKTIGWICSQVASVIRCSRTGCFISRVALPGGRIL